MPLFSRKDASREAFSSVLDEVERDAPEAPRQSRMRVPSSAGLERMFMATLCFASVTFCAVAINTSLKDPDYFSRKLISSLQRDDVDPVVTGSIGAAPAASLPVPALVRRKALTPADYQIVMIYEGEAILATDDELLRVKVGSVLPGLGTVKEIRPTEKGGSIIADEATLSSGAGR